MKTPYSLTRAQDMINMTNTVKSDQYYLKSRKNRNELASIFKQLMNCGGSFPPRPLSMNSHLPRQLAKRTSNSCPYCVKESQMKKYIQQAKDLINQYADILKVWLDDSDYQELSDDVHELEPTKK
jgi:hypothetical protein